jgi:hypothetical protein
MTQRITGGWLDGHPIRKARKAHLCDYWHGIHNGGRCNKPINPGDQYVEGDPNDDAGGYGADRYCFDCIKPEDRRTP